MVIGSGATAVTLVPAMAETGVGHVTMLQRSPTYILSLPAVDGVARLLRRLLPERAAYAVTRWKNVAIATLVYQLSQRRPRFMRGVIRKQNSKLLPVGYDVDTHFKPRYDPWDQRLCLVPDGNLFRALRSGTAEIVTDTIDTFTETGLRLASGRELDADIIVTATGLNLMLFGGIELTVDGVKPDLREQIAYKALMLSGLPNFAFTIGYTNASWTLKADLVAEYVCRLLAHLDEHGHRIRRTRPRHRTCRSGRSSTSRPATCSARSTACPSRATASRGGCGRTTSTTSARSGAARSTTAPCGSADHTPASAPIHGRRPQPTRLGPTTRPVLPRVPRDTTRPSPSRRGTASHSAAGGGRHW